MALKFTRLTRPAIRALEICQRINEHGIAAERLTNNDVRYSVNIMVDGQRIHRVIGRESDGVTREQAERAIETLRTKAREGRLDLPKGRKTHRSFTEAADEYLERLEESDGKNIKAKNQHLTMHLKPFFGTERLDKISAFSLDRYRKARRTAGASDATVNREMATLSHMLRSAVAWKWMRADCVPEIKKAAEAKKPIAILTEEQAESLMQSAIADQDARLWLFVAFGLGAAMRHREILKVRYDQIDFENRRVFIPQAKAGEREQPITPSLAAALKEQRQMEKDKKGWVFPSVIPRQAKAGHRTNMGRQFARAVVRAGLDPDRVTPHTMRHTAITRLVKAGVDLPTIQRISGHKTLAMVLRYTHVHGQHIDLAISAIDRPIAAAVTPELHNPTGMAKAERGKVFGINAGKSRR
jgi:integrase